MKTRRWEELIAETHELTLMGQPFEAEPYRMDVQDALLSKSWKYVFDENTLKRAFRTQRAIQLLKFSQCA